LCLKKLVYFYNSSHMFVCWRCNCCCCFSCRF